ncbi:MAG: hypothetical protein WAO28_03535 [Candidatus Microsaccharimonas sp.]
MTKKNSSTTSLQPNQTIAVILFAAGIVYAMFGLSASLDSSLSDSSVILTTLPGSVLITLGLIVYRLKRLALTSIPFILAGVILIELLQIIFLGILSLGK